MSNPVQPLLTCTERSAVCHNKLLSKLKLYEVQKKDLQGLLAFLAKKLVLLTFPEESEGILLPFMITNKINKHLKQQQKKG